MYLLKCKCGAVMHVNPPVLKQKKTRCLNCNNLQKISDYEKSDSQGFFFRFGDKK